MENKYPKVGVGVLVFKDGKVLLGQRKGAHGEGEYAGTGGHLEFGESIIDCASRETREEAGIEIHNLRFQCVSNWKAHGKHYVDLGIIADWKSGEPTIMEPHKLVSWGWYDVTKLPKPLFSVLDNYFEAIKTGKNYFDV